MFGNGVMTGTEMIITKTLPNNSRKDLPTATTLMDRVCPKKWYEADPFFVMHLTAKATVYRQE